MESDLVAYSAVHCLEARAVLVLAPHPDDEVFGCGGAIAAHVAAGVPVDVLVLTDGAAFGCAEDRARESEAAAQVIGYGSPMFWRLPDRGLFYDEQWVQRLYALAVGRCVDLVYAPSPWEVHPDHRQAMMLARELVLRMGGTTRLAFYEVGSPLHPNVLLDLTPVLVVKQAAMACFGSQLAQQDYARHISGLNQFRTYTLGPEVQAAEAFRVLSAAELGQPTGGFWGGAALDMAAQGAVAPMPLVSVVVRSMDRMFLPQALDSVALQTYAAIEVVVVAVVPDHRPVPAQCGPFELRLLPTDTPLPRSQAANKALQNARGQYLLFLDDDDWLMPSHISRLVDVMLRQPNALSAYTGISLVDVSGKPLGQTFDLPFDAIRQRSGNLTPIHAVLFSAKVLALGCRFDEALDRYEDWDFWLQLARLSPMVHLPGVSGVYRIHESSGVHVDAEKNSASTVLIYRKWLQDWTPELLGQMMQRVWAYPDMQAQLAERGAALEQAKKTADTAMALAGLEREKHQGLLGRIHELEQINMERLSASQDLQDEIAALHQSVSWRMTQPWRWLAGWLRLRHWYRRIAVRCGQEL